MKSLDKIINNAEIAESNTAFIRTLISRFLPSVDENITRKIVNIVIANLGEINSTLDLHEFIIEFSKQDFPKENASEDVFDMEILEELSCVDLTADRLKDLMSKYLNSSNRLFSLLMDLFSEVDAKPLANRFAILDKNIKTKVEDHSSMTRKVSAHISNEIAAILRNTSCTGVAELNDFSSQVKITTPTANILAVNPSSETSDLNSINKTLLLRAVQLMGVLLTSHAEIIQQSLFQQSSLVRITPDLNKFAKQLVDLSSALLTLFIYSSITKANTSELKGNFDPLRLNNDLAQKLRILEGSLDNGVLTRIFTFLNLEHTPKVAENARIQDEMSEIRRLIAVLHDATKQLELSGDAIEEAERLMEDV